MTSWNPIQKLIHHVRARLEIQGQASTNTTNTLCYYRHPSLPLCCGMGVIIPDFLTPYLQEGKSIRQQDEIIFDFIQNQFNLEGYSLEYISEALGWIQDIHDLYHHNEWWDEFQSLIEYYKEN